MNVKTFFASRWWKSEEDYTCTCVTFEIHVDHIGSDETYLYDIRRKYVEVLSSSSEFRIPVDFLP